MPKWRVMLISNGIKVVGCALMFVARASAARLRRRRSGRRRLLAGQVRHPHRISAAPLLVVANGWIEGLTVGAIILGT
jgi:LPLT family lysophospholipid transporter-like MFS transporter